MTEESKRPTPASEWRKTPGAGGWRPMPDDQMQRVAATITPPIERALQRVAESIAPAFEAMEQSVADELAKIDWDPILDRLSEQVATFLAGFGGAADAVKAAQTIDWDQVREAVEAGPDSPAARAVDVARAAIIATVVQLLVALVGSSQDASWTTTAWISANLSGAIAVWAEYERKRTDGEP